jgi:tetraacyldisaccharide 4'-kinase
VILRTVLTPVSWLYAACWQTYLLTYKLGLKKPAEPHPRVICIGNLVVGGSGKSPLTLFVARQLQGLGYGVVLSCSGYGSPASEAAQLAPPGELDAAQWGDEPAMFRMLAPDLPIVVGRRRVLAAQLVRQHYPNAVMLMDDGFQHLPLKKHLTIIIEKPSRNRRCLPAGPYREPPSNASRADLVVGPGSPFVLRQSTFLDGELSGQVQALCALGDPRGFMGSLAGMGLLVVREKSLPDHDPLDAGNLFAGFDPKIPIVVTAKDWVKLRRRADLGGWDIQVAMLEVSLEPQDEFRAWLADRLNGP